MQREKRMQMNILKTLLLGVSLILFVACSDTDTVDEAIDKIVAYATSAGTPPVPTVQDYIDAGVTGITADNLDEMNEVVSNLTGEEVDTTEEIQTLANELGLEAMPPTQTCLEAAGYEVAYTSSDGQLWLNKSIGASEVGGIGTYYTQEDAINACPCGFSLATMDDYEVLFMDAEEGSSYAILNFAKGGYSIDSSLDFLNKENYGFYWMQEQDSYAETHYGVIQLSSYEKDISSSTYLQARCNKWHVFEE